VDVVQLGEFAVLFRGGELLKLALRLPPQVVPIHQKENALCTRVLDEPIAEIARRKSLSPAACHLNQRARIGVRE